MTPPHSGRDDSELTAAVRLVIREEIDKITEKFISIDTFGIVHNDLVRRIVSLEDNQKWTLRLLITSVVGAVITLLLTFASKL